MQSPATRCRSGAASRGDVQSKCQGVLAVRWFCLAAARHIDTPVFWGGYGCLEGAGCRAAIAADALELETGSGSGPVDEGLEVQRAIAIDLGVAQKVDIAAIAVEEEIASEGSPAHGHGRDDTELPRGGQGVLATARPCKRMGVSYNSERNPGAFTASNVV